MANGLTDEMRKRLRHLSTELFDKGQDPKKVLGLSKETVEGLYASAYNFYHGGNHNLAAHFFRMLALISPEDPRFYLGIAASLHQMKQYANATYFYKMAAALDKDNPLPEFYESDCFIRLSQFDEAIVCLKSVIRKGEDQPTHQTIVDRAKLTLAKLQKSS